MVPREFIVLNNVVLPRHIFDHSPSCNLRLHDLNLYNESSANYTWRADSTIEGWIFKSVEMIE